MNEVDRNKQLFLLLQYLIQNEKWEYIKLVKTFVDNDSMAIRKTFEIMTGLYEQQIS